MLSEQEVREAIQALRRANRELIRIAVQMAKEAPDGAWENRAVEVEEPLIQIEHMILVVENTLFEDEED